MAALDPFKIIVHPYVTEKTMYYMERENKLEFIVHRSATKKDIREAVEKLFEAKVVNVNTKITKRGKKAVVQFSKDYRAEDIGMRIGVF